MAISYFTPGRAIICTLFLILVTQFSCTERDRDNIFDPDAEIDSVDLRLSVDSADSLITLSWAMPYSVEYSGFNVYRKIEGESNFRFLNKVNKNRRAYRDTVLNYDLEYQYYITILGIDGESPPSFRTKSVPGPVSFWILDHGLFIIANTTFDLRHNRLLMYGIWAPENMAFDNPNKRALVTYPLYHYLELFDTETGRIYANQTDIEYPYDCLYNQRQARFWVTDSSGGLYSVDPQTGASLLLSNFPQKPHQIRINSDNNIFLIDKGRNSILNYSFDGSLKGEISQVGDSTLTNPIWIEPAGQSDKIYIIDRKADTRVLYSYNLSTDTIDWKFEDIYLNRIQQSPKTGETWVSINSPSGASLVQLSERGLRQKKLDGFYFIRDFIINPYNGAFVVADTGNDSVVHIREDGRIIGIYPRFIYPNRVYNQ